VAAFLVLGGSSEQSGVAGDSAALLDADDGHVQTEVAVGATPIDVVSDASAAWTLDGDAQTISRVTPQGGRALTKAPGVTATALSLGDGELWATYVERNSAGTRVGVAALDPSTLTEHRRRALAGIGPDFLDNPRSSTPTAPSGSAGRTIVFENWIRSPSRSGKPSGSERRRALWPPGSGRSGPASREVWSASTP
jgi:hypothetical protein